MGDSEFRVVTRAAPARRHDDRHAVRRHEPRPAVTRRNSTELAGTGSRSSATDCSWRQHADAARARGSSSRRRRQTSRWTARSTLDGESYAFRRLVAVGDTVFYALESIDESSRAAMRDAMRSLAFIALWRARARRCSAASGSAQPAEPADRTAVGFARRDGGVARRSARGLPLDRIEPGARHAHRNVQRADGVGRQAEARNRRRRTPARHPRAGGGARRARSRTPPATRTA